MDKFYSTPSNVRDGDDKNERTPLLPDTCSDGGPNPGSIRRPASALEFPNPRESLGVRKTSYGTQLPGSWANYYRPSPYTDETKPNRRPFHIPKVTSSSTIAPSSSGEGSFGGYSSADDFLTNDVPVGGGGRADVSSNPPSRRTSVVTDPHSQLYTRYRYYSRLRAPADPDDHVLVIPDHVIPIDFFLPFIPGSEVLGADGKQASYITIVSIWNTMMGTSLLTMPWAFGKAGFAGGFIIMITMAFVCLFTAYRILTVQRVAGGVWGRVVEGGAIIFSIITLLGALVVYWVLMSNFLYNTGLVIHDSIYVEPPDHNTTTGVLCPVNMSLTVHSLGPGVVSRPVTAMQEELLDDEDVEKSVFDRVWDRRLTVPFYLLVLFVPLLCIKNTHIFSYFNSMGAVSVFAIYLFVIVKAFSWGLNLTLTDSESPFFIPMIKGEFMALSGTLSLAYFIHNCIITIMKGNRKQENNVRDLTIAFFMVAMTYIPIGVIFYLTFPLPKYCLADNFLDNFPPHAIVLAVVRVFLLFQMVTVSTPLSFQMVTVSTLLSFQMVTVFPLLCVFLRTQLLCYIRGPLAPPPSFLTSSLVNFVLLTTCVLVAVFFPKVGFLIRWVGAFSGLVYVFLLPCGLYLKAVYSKGELTVWTGVLHVLVILLGADEHNTDVP
ncbi:Amino acid transporter transmembrane domain [Trinorchestia longiramus]|nr:Amino acid transporter transmembrane domain [Trinorchestia longiramus]